MNEEMRVGRGGKKQKELTMKSIQIKENTDVKNFRNVAARPDWMCVYSRSAKVVLNCTRPLVSYINSCKQAIINMK